MKKKNYSGENRAVVSNHSNEEVKILYLKSCLKFKLKCRKGYSIG